MSEGGIQALELRHLRAFVAVAETEHVTRAAARLRIAQPALSRQIQHVEAAVGAALFTREGRGIRLTPAGRAFVADARAIIASVTAAATRAREVERGVAGILRVGFVEVASVSGLLPEAVRRFSATHPGIAVDLREMTSAEQVAALASGTLDVGFVCGFVAAQARAPRPITVLADPLVAVLADGHTLAHHRRITPAALAGERILMVRRQLAPMLHADVEAVFARAGASVPLVQEVSQMQTVLHMAEAGVGVGVIPRSAAAGSRGAVLRPIAGLDARHRTQLIVNAEQSPAATAFSTICEQAARTLRRVGAS